MSATKLNTKLSKHYKTETIFKKKLNKASE